MFNITLAETYEKVCTLTSYAMAEVQKIEFQEHANKALTEVTNAAKPVFEIIAPYTPYVAASMAGILAAKGLDGLTNHKATKYPWTNLALSAMVGSLVYHQNIENLSPFSQIFLASAFVTAVYLGKHPPVKYTHTVRTLDTRVDPGYHARINTNQKREQFTPSWPAKNYSAPLRVHTTTVNGVRRPMTTTEEGHFARSMRNAFGPGSAFEQAFGRTSY